MDYKGKIVFNVEHQPTYGSIDVEIDFDHTFEVKGEKVTKIEQITQMQSFWTGSESRLDENDDDVVLAFLKQLCQKCMYLAIEHNVNYKGLISLFNEGQEGYCALDGSAGIELHNSELPDFDEQDDYEVSELKNYKK